METSLLEKHIPFSNVISSSLELSTTNIIPLTSVVLVRRQNFGFSHAREHVVCRFLKYVFAAVEVF